MPNEGPTQKATSEAAKQAAALTKLCAGAPKRPSPVRPFLLLPGWVGVVGGAVGGGEGEGVVGVAGDGPAVVDHFVVFAAEQAAVGSGGGATVGPVDDVVHFRVPGWCVTP